MCNSTDYIFHPFNFFNELHNLVPRALEKRPGDEVANYTQVVQNLITLVSISVSRTLRNWMIYDKYNLGKIIYIVQYCIVQVCFPLWSLPWLWLLPFALWVCLTSRGTVASERLCVILNDSLLPLRTKNSLQWEKLCGFIWNFWISFFTYFWISTYFMSSRIFFCFSSCFSSCSSC